MEKQSFSLKILSGDFYGQSFIKTVRGPLEPDQGPTNSSTLMVYLKVNFERVNLETNQ